MSIIEVNNLSKEFGDVTAVDDVSFRVEAGEIFGFLGPNGAGKSTTIQMLVTLLPPTSGSAQLAGYDVVKQAVDVRRKIGIVFQDPSLDNQLTAAENLRFHAQLYGVPRDVYKQRTDEVLEMMDLSDRRDSLVKTFSGGMKRRLEIARGFLHHPSVLFLDEPTVGLDPQTRSAIWEYVKALRNETGVTVFMTTHYLDEAENCDRIAIIDHGRIVALDGPTELKRQLHGDTINLKGADLERLAAELKERFGFEATVTSDRLSIQVEDAAHNVPRVLSAVGDQVESIEIKQPSLDDVFLQLTGREIRDEGASSNAMRRMWGGRSR